MNFDHPNSFNAQSSMVIHQWSMPPAGSFSVAVWPGVCSQWSGASRRPCLRGREGCGRKLLRLWNWTVGQRRGRQGLQHSTFIVAFSLCSPSTAHTLSKHLRIKRVSRFWSFSVILGSACYYESPHQLLTLWHRLIPWSKGSPPSSMR